MATPHIISASVLAALNKAVGREDVGALCDAFVEAYIQAQVGTRDPELARGIDDICVMALNGPKG